MFRVEAERKIWLYSKVVKDAVLDKLLSSSAPPKNLRIIPAGKVVIMPAVRRGPGGKSPGGRQINGNKPDQKKSGSAGTAGARVLSEPASIDNEIEERAREFERRFQSGKESAFREGFEQGKSRGFDEGILGVQNIENLLDKINKDIVDQRDDFILRGEKAVARLAVEIAEAVIGEAVMKSSKELLDFNLKRCLDVLGGSGKVIIKINPADYEFAEEQLTGRLSRDSDRFVFEFVPDPAITPGGCYIETNGGAIDARVESQFEQLKQSFLQLV